MMLLDGVASANIANTPFPLNWQSLGDAYSAAQSSFYHGHVGQQVPQNALEELVAEQEALDLWEPGSDEEQHDGEDF